MDVAAHTDESRSIAAAQRRRLPRMMAFVVAVAGLTFLGVWIGTSRIVGPVLKNGLEVEPASLNFGEVWLQTAFQRTLPIKNLTSEDLVIRGFRTSCNCTSIEPEQLTIPAGATRNVTLTVDLTKGAQPVSGRSDQREYVVDVVPEVDSPWLQREVWRLRGEVRSLFTVYSPRIVFGGDLIRGVAAKPKAVELECVSPVRSMTADAQESFIVPTITEVQPARAYRLQVELTDAVPAGPLEATINIDAETVSGESVVGFPVKVLGFVTQDVEAVPSELALGGVPVGHTVVNDVVLASRSAKRFRIPFIDLPGTGDVVATSSSDDGGRRVFHVRQTASQPGAQIREIRFHVKQGDRPAYTVPLRVLFTGVEQSPGGPKPSHEKQEPYRDS